MATVTTGSPLTEYLKEVGSYALLTQKEEVTLSRLALQGDVIAKRTMVCANLRLVVVIAKRMVPQSKMNDMILDVIQEGNLGLMKAVEKYDPVFKARFATYAAYWIRQTIFRYLHANRLIRLPENISNLLYRVRRKQMEMLDTLDRMPTTDELAQEVGLSTQRIETLLLYMEEVVSLDKYVAYTDPKEKEMIGFELADRDTLPPDEQAQLGLNKTYMRRALQVLPQRQREIVCLRYGLTDGVPYTLSEIAQKYNISRERVRQITVDALDRLQKNSTELLLAQLN